MSEKSGRQLWDDVVLCANRSNSDCIKSLRISLFILLSGEKSIREQARHLISSIRKLLTRRRRGLPKALLHRSLFCFPHQTASNIKNLLPVAQEAYRRGQLGGIVAFSGFRKDLAEFDGQIPIVTEDSIVSQLRIRSRCELVKQAISTYKEISRQLSAVDEFLGKRYRRNAGSAISDVITSLLAGCALEILLDLWSPSSVVSTSDLWPFEYQLAHQASRKGIPSFVIQHGSVIYFYWPFEASAWLVWGQQSLDEMVTIGTPAERLIVAGMPASDTLFSDGGNGEATGRSTKDLPVCVILSHTNGSYLEPELFANYKQFISHVIPATPFVRWKVKLHPSEDRAFYADLDPATLARLEFYPRTAKLEDVFREADIATTLYSTSGLEAMIAGLPLIVPIVSPRMTEPGLLPQVPGALFVHTGEDFIRTLKALVSDTAYRAGVLKSQKEGLKYGFSNQGGASQAIMDIVCRYANDGLASNEIEMERSL